MRRFGIFALCLALFVVLAACGGGGADGEEIRLEGGPGLADDAILENYIYLPTISPMPHVTEYVQRTVLHEGRIYFAYVSENAIVVESILPDGEGVSRFDLPLVGDAVDIAALHFTEAGNLKIILTSFEWTEEESEPRVLYLEVDAQGAELYRRELEGLVPPEGGFFQIGGVVFTSDGLVLLIFTDMGVFIYLFDESLSQRAQLEPLDFPEIMGETRDGRVLVIDRERETGDLPRPILREIDLEAAHWGDVLPHPAAMLLGDLHPARAGEPFDLYVDDGVHLFGYDLETMEQTMILKWTEAGIADSRAHHLNFLDDGRISLLVSVAEGDSWRTEHIMLTRTPRGELPEREVIVLGGWLIQGVEEQVIAFNGSSQTHEIQLRDYMDSEAFDWDNPTAGLFEFHMDLLTGQGPDILFGFPSTLAPVVERGIALDLYPFIDADPVLCRSDFLPNILHSMEAPDGSLPLISNSFSIGTMFGLPETVGDIESWTFAEMLALVERAEAANVPYPLGDFWLPRMFVYNMLGTSDVFLDFGANRVDLDNEDFIRLLEIAQRIGIGEEDFPMGPSAMTRTLQGEQWVLHAGLFSPAYYQMYTAVLGEDIVALGYPSPAGGDHAILQPPGLAINAASPHQDAAWSFIRKMLLPEESIDWLPLRIDLFDAMILEVSTPVLQVNAEGQEVEVPRGSKRTGDVAVDIYAMTEAEERGFRAIVEGAGLRIRNDTTVTEMVFEEIAPFFAGDRSAAETARILQSRVQIFMSERR